MASSTTKRPAMIRKLDSYSPETWGAIEAFAAEYRERHPGIRFEMTDAVRYLVHRGLETVGKEQAE
jgi:hypothetical protein